MSEQVPEQVAKPKVTNEIGSNTPMVCGFKVVKGKPVTSGQGPRTPFPPIPGLSVGSSSLDVVLHNQSQLKAELSEVKTTMAAEKALHATHHEDLLATLSALTAKLSPLDLAKIDPTCKPDPNPPENSGF